MANRRWTANEQLKVTDSASRPKPGVGGVSRQTVPTKTANWASAPGPKGTGYNPDRLGFTEIKTHVKQDMADDSSMQGMMQAMPQQMAKAMASMQVPARSRGTTKRFRGRMF